MTEYKKLKSWQGWLLFAACMVVVFCLGLLAASVTERRAEIQSIFANKKTELAPGEARNTLFEPNYPREYQTWLQTADTSFASEFNGNKKADVLAMRPEMVVLWAGYAFSRGLYSAPRSLTCY